MYFFVLPTADNVERGGDGYSKIQHICCFHLHAGVDVNISVLFVSFQHQILCSRLCGGQSIWFIIQIVLNIYTVKDRRTEALDCSYRIRSAHTQ